MRWKGTAHEPRFGSDDAPCWRKLPVRCEPDPVWSVDRSNADGEVWWVDNELEALVLLAAVRKKDHGAAMFVRIMGMWEDVKA